jgi:hypothetical protein
LSLTQQPNQQIEAPSLQSPLSGPPGDGHNTRRGRSLAVAVTQSLTASHRSWLTEVILGDPAHGQDAFADVTPVTALELAGRLRLSARATSPFPDDGKMVTTLAPRPAPYVAISAYRYWAHAD